MYSGRLYSAALVGNLDETKAELQKTGVDVNQTNKCGMTPLMYAAFGGHFMVAEELLKAGADVHKVDKYNQSPLYFASEKGFSDLVELLARAGSDPNKSNVYGWFPLYWAVYNGNPTMVEVLLRAGADPNKKYCSSDGNNYCSLVYTCIVRNSLSVMSILLKAGADPNQLIAPGETALCFASGRNQVSMVKKLAMAGADLNYESMFSLAPIWCAAVKGCIEVVKMLLEFGAKPKHAMDYEKTLHNVQENGHYEIAELLERWPRINSLRMMCLRVVHFSPNKPFIPAWVPPVILQFDLEWELLPLLKKGEKRKREEK